MQNSRYIEIDWGNMASMWSHRRGETTSTIVSRIADHSQRHRGESQVLAQQNVAPGGSTEDEYAKPITVEAELIGHELHQAEKHHHQSPDDQERPHLWSLTTLSQHHRANDRNHDHRGQ